MASFNKYQHFVASISNKKYNFASDTLKIALTVASPVNTNVAIGDITQISYTNLSSQTITTTSSVQTSGTYNLILVNWTGTASGAVASFRYVTIQNSTATSFELVGWYDYGSSVTLANGDTFTVSFDQTNGLFSLA